VGKKDLVLVLSRKVGEEIVIGDSVRVLVVEIRGNRVRLGVAAPDNVAVDRQEVRDRQCEPITCLAVQE
jgi:carbon storage regulator